MSKYKKRPNRYPDEPVGMKSCTKCRQLKALGEFRSHSRGRRGVIARCKKCEYLVVREWVKANPQRHRAYHRTYYLTTGSDARCIKEYGISLEQKESLFNAQGRVCASCGTDTPKSKNGVWQIDHDHLTGVVRGVVCMPCNVALGCVRDSLAHLESLRKYLERAAVATIGLARPVYPPGLFSAC